MLATYWHTNSRQIKLLVDCDAQNINVSIIDYHSHVPVVWQAQLPPSDQDLLIQRVNSSLAQVPQIDIIVHTIHADSSALSWQFGTQLCALLPLPLMISHSLAYVACIDDSHPNNLEIEAYFRKQSLIWASQRVRINCIRQNNQTIPSDTTLAFLTGRVSRSLTGGLFLADGQMLLGGHPTAERIITQQYMQHQID